MEVVNGQYGEGQTLEMFMPNVHAQGVLDVGEKTIRDIVSEVSDSITRI